MNIGRAKIQKVIGTGLLSFQIAACAAANEPYILTEADSGEIHTELFEYYSDFVDEYGRVMTVIPMTIGPLEKGVAGKCYRPGKKDVLDQVADSFTPDESQATEKRIVISSDFFKNNKHHPPSIQQVVFHELGHCYLDRGHKSLVKRNRDGLHMPVSIMHPNSFGAEPYYKTYFKYYAKELFQPQKNSVKLLGSIDLQPTPQLSSWRCAHADDGVE